jgi:hypothetical protein
LFLGSGEKVLEAGRGLFYTGKEYILKFESTNQELFYDNDLIYSVTSENQTPMGLAKKFGFLKFPELRTSELLEQVESMKHKDMMKSI